MSGMSGIQGGMNVSLLASVSRPSSAREGSAAEEARESSAQEKAEQQTQAAPSTSGKGALVDLMP